MKLIEKCSNLQVVICISKNEKYGISTYSKELKKRIEKDNISVEIKKFNLFEVIIYALRNPKKFMIFNTSGGICSLLFRKRSAYILHGFPNLSDYSFIKFIAIIFITYISSKFSTHTIANSPLTYEINKKFYRIYSDEIWNPKSDAVMQKNTSSNIQRKPSLLFAGRYSKAKGITYISDYLCENYNKFSKIEFIGSGNISLLEPVAGLPNVQISDYIDRDHLKQRYNEFDMFISLNFFEPYGFVFEETINSGLIVIMPKFTGISHYLQNNSKLVLVTSSQKKDIENAFNEAFNKLNKDA